MLPEPSPSNFATPVDCNPVPESVAAYEHWDSQLPTCWMIFAGCLRNCIPSQALWNWLHRPLLFGVTSCYLLLCHGCLASHGSWSAVLSSWGSCSFSWWIGCWRRRRHCFRLLIPLCGCRWICLLCRLVELTIWRATPHSITGFSLWVAWHDRQASCFRSRRMSEGMASTSHLPSLPSLAMTCFCPGARPAPHQCSADSYSHSVIDRNCCLFCGGCRSNHTSSELILTKFDCDFAFDFLNQSATHL